MVRGSEKEKGFGDWFGLGFSMKTFGLTEQYVLVKAVFVLWVETQDTNN